MPYIKRMLANRLGMAVFAALTVGVVYGVVVLADTIIYGGNNTIYEDSNANVGAAPDDLNIGAVATQTVDLLPGFTGLRLSPFQSGDPACFRRDMGDLRNNGSTRCHHIEDFAAASSTSLLVFAEQNTAGRTLQIDRLNSYLRITGQPTTTVSWYSATSSRGVTEEGLDIQASAVMKDLTTATNTPTSTTMLFAEASARFAESPFILNSDSWGTTGTRRYGDVGARFVPWLPGEWLLVYATTTTGGAGVGFNSAVTSTGRLLDGTVYIEAEYGD